MTSFLLYILRCLLCFEIPTRSFHSLRLTICSFPKFHLFFLSNFESMKNHKMLSAILMAVICSAVNKTFSQAQLSGNVKDIVNKRGVNNVRIMVVTANDTAYHTPDIHGNFNFMNKAGKTQIYAISDGYVNEINSVNTTNGSKSTVNIALVPAAKYEHSKEKRANWDMENKSSYQVMAQSVSRKACALPGIKPVKQTLPGSAYRILTASEINDFAKWQLNGDTKTPTFIASKTTWKFILDTRIPVQVTLQNNTPVVDAVVHLTDYSGNIIWSSKTDNTGKAELWPDAFSRSVSLDSLKILILYSGSEFSFFVRSRVEPIQNFVIDMPCAVSNNLDIAFVVDATGSMGDEINFIKNDLDTFIKQVSQENKDINVRLGSVFYRDKGDAYVAKYSPFSSNSDVTDNFILSQTAAGGGDYPEAVHTALEYACDSLEWSENARSRIMFLILDAGAHPDDLTKESIKKYTRIAAAKGIRIVPVVCSGLQSSDAVLLRAMAMATNGTNIFLNNLNPLGNTFLEPSGDHYKEETLSELMNRITRQFSVVPDCDNKVRPAVISITDSLLYSQNPNGEHDTSYLQLSNAEWTHTIDTIEKKDSIVITNVNIVHSFVKIYPNPTPGPLSIRTSAEIKTMYLADVTGKVLEQIHVNSEGFTQINIDRYSSGIYYLKYPTRRGWGAERIILQRD